MKNIHFFPKTIKQLVNGKVVEIDFNIEQMIPEFLVKEFGMENIVNTIDELKMTYSDITSIVGFTSTFSDYYTKGWYDISMTELVEKRDNYNNITKSYWKYTCYVFSLIGIGTELINKLVTNKFPYLSEFKGVKTVSFNPYEFVNKHTRLQDIPNEFRGYTINELTEMVGIQEKQSECSLLKCYADSSVDFDKYQIYLKCPEVINQFGDVDSLYIPYKALTENDFSAIYNNTKSYLESYYKPCTKDNLKVLTCETAMKLKKLMS